MFGERYIAGSLSSARTAYFVTPYWILFGIWTLGSIQFARQQSARRYDTFFFVLAAVLTTAMIGLRYQVGGDWFNYERIYDKIYFQPLPVALTMSDPAYGALNWLGARMDAGIWPANLVCGACFMLGLSRLCLRQPNPWLAMVVAVPYLIIVVAMGYTRQAAAIGILCYAIADASPNNVPRTVLYIALAAIFHKSALLMLPLFLAPVATRNLLVGAIGVIAFVVLFNLILGSSTDKLLTNYVKSNYDSQGAAIRISMNVAAAVIFFTLRRRMELPAFQQSFWTYGCLAATLSVPALFISGGTAGVDRLSLFLIPLQVITYSRLPYALRSFDRPYVPAIFSIIAYSFAVNFVWLNYAANASGWLPYQISFVSDLNT